MTKSIEREIQELTDLETEGWDTKNPDLFLSQIHPDMVWPWPPTTYSHDPEDWIFVMGRFYGERRRKIRQEMFDVHDLIHNHRITQKIEISEQRDGSFAVVDIDLLWRNKETGEDFHWKGRVCKIYTRMPGGEWKLISHTGALNYPPT